MFGDDTTILDNGLKVVMVNLPKMPSVIVNLLYDVGSKDEDLKKKGLAHLYEHMMFTGTRNIPGFHQALNRAGGTFNAFTTSDLTNYHITLPAANLEYAFWLESDRMENSNFDAHSLQIQRSVVLEEFKEVYTNRPYANHWLKLRPLVYQKHPYHWPTIGCVDDIAQISIDDVNAFSQKFYTPNNAVLVVAGSIRKSTVIDLANKWFGPIPTGPQHDRQLPFEPVQTGERKLYMEGTVPFDAIYKAYRAPARYLREYQSAVLLNSLLGGDKSSRLYNSLIKNGGYFASINSYLTETLDDGLLVIEGKLSSGIDMEQANRRITEVTEEFLNNGFSEHELTKAKKKQEMSALMAKMVPLNNAIDIAQAVVAGKPESVIQELPVRDALTPTDVTDISRLLLTHNCSTIYYQSTNI